MSLNLERPPVEPTLRILRLLAPAATAAMAITVAVGLLTAPDGAAAELLGNVWGRVTVVDLYLALGALWTWIAWRDRKVSTALLWAVLLVTTGSIAAWGYVAWRASSVGSMAELLTGQTDIR